jgi:hypothetical protein
MKKGYTLQFNPFAIVTVTVALILGFNGLVSWWVILLLALSSIKIIYNWDF